MMRKVWNYGFNVFQWTSKSGNATTTTTSSTYSRSSISNMGNLPTFPKGPSDIVTGKIVGHSEQDVNKIVKLVDALRENSELQYLVDQVDSRDKKLNVTIKEYLDFKTPNPRSTQMYYILSAWSYPLFGCWAREILLYALLLKLFDYSIYLVISPKLLAFKAEIA